MDLPAIERQCVIDGLLKQETERFDQICALSIDRSKWENKHAHLEDAAKIRMLACEITALASRREYLERENEQTKHP